MKVKGVFLAGAVIALAAGAVGVSAASASTAFDLTFTTSDPLPGNGCCGPFDVTAKLLADWTGSSYEITQISGTVTEGSGPNPGVYNIVGLIPGTNDPLDTLSFDNLINASSENGPYSFDINGLGFYATNPSYYAETNSDPASSLSAFNIYLNGSSYQLSTTASYDVNTAFNGAAKIAPVPEPAAWAMMLVGFAGIGAMLRSRRRLALAA